MKTLSKITIIVLLISFGAKAQEDEKPGNQKIEAARIGMITNRLNLTPEQATVFWPIYNDFESRKKEIKKSLRKHLSESRSLANTDDKILLELKELMALRQKEVDLDKEHLNKFLKVLNPRQVSELYRSEQMFKQMLLKKLEERREQKR
jgi:Spy/CpxP family protein refolding chaperone